VLELEVTREADDVVVVANAKRFFVRYRTLYSSSGDGSSFLVTSKTSVIFAVLVPLAS
jgi:hypothetical protein